MNKRAQPSLLKTRFSGKSSRRTAMKPDRVLDNIKQAIHRQDPTAEAYLFGSRARGTH